MTGRFLSALLVNIFAATIPAAYAGLERVGPVDLTNGGYPAWYQDKTGIALEFCKPATQAELNDGWCLILPPDVPNGAAPEVPFTNYAEEHFYWNATSGSRTANAVLVLSLEGAFGIGPPVAGDQIVFGRVRITVPSLQESGTYKVYTPFGDFTFPDLQAGERLFFTSDIGIGCGTEFSCALNSAVGPFLLPAATPGGAEVPPIPDLIKGSGTDPFYDSLPAATPYPGNGKKYISDPARLGPVTGSPLPTFTAVDGVTYDHNRFLIEVNGRVIVNEPNFTTMGRLMTATIPAQVHITRASYAQTATAKKLDVFATASHAVAGRLPAATAQPLNKPDLGFYDAPCATDAVTGAVTGPPAAAPGQTFFYYQMLNSAITPANWWGQNAPLEIPAQVCVQDLNARNAANLIVPAYFLGDVTDEINLFVAGWDPALNGGTLTVAATSNDKVNAPALTLSGFGPLNDPCPAWVPAGYQCYVKSDLPGPPAKVAVVSTRGGVAERDVTTLVGIPVSTTTPVANADQASTPEDTTATSIAVLTNDRLNNQPLPAGATVAITAQGRIGTAILNADNTIRYTPNANVNGTDIVGYTVTAGSATSNEGYLTVIITPVNDIPVANNDTAGAPNNKSVTINVLANDQDPDGASDLAAAVLASVPAAGATLTCNGGAAATAGTVCAGGQITFTPSVLGTLTFSYRAQDSAGALSPRAATVTVTVNATEAIVITKSQYVVSKNRWVVTGTDAVPAGQTLTIKYDITTPPTYKVNGVCTAMTASNNPVIGTAPVDALGNWSFDAILTTAGFLNPSNTGGNSTGFWCSPPKALRITSPLGGIATSNITLK